MRQKLNLFTLIFAAAALALGVTPSAQATEPCDDFGECKALIEINASDGDIGFHFLMDGDNLVGARMHDPNGVKLFQDRAYGPLREQYLTEMFAESAEPLCWDDPEAEEDDEIVTLEEFLDRWTSGTYVVSGVDGEGEMVEGETELTFDLPAAPDEDALDFDEGVITWAPGDDLGNCADYADLMGLVTGGVLDTHPADVPVAAWEIVLEPDVESDHPNNGLKFSIRVAGDIDEEDMEITVPEEYLDSLEENTPVKVEVGAIGFDDNATFSEADGFCANEEGDGCEEEEEEEEGSIKFGT